MYFTNTLIIQKPLSKYLYNICRLNENVNINLLKYQNIKIEIHKNDTSYYGTL